ncbi:MAG: type II CRISPR-associated endonuclease Cas1 [Wenzhouxiangellaceae bacterium]
MSKRIIEISNPAYLHIDHRQLVIEKDKQRIASIPVEDMAALVLATPQVVMTHAAIGFLLSQNVAVVSCDGKHQPVGLFMHLQGNVLRGERLSLQSEMKYPLKKSLWKDIVKAKIRLQAKVASDVCGSENISPLIRKVRSGDPDNIEAQAARRYWPRLFPDQFRRDRDADDQNRLLNYGYAIVRALVARSLCAAGLHPGLGLHHRNRYNDFPLADDVMEPYRPFVDLTVWQLVEDGLGQAEMDTDIRKRLIEVVKHPVKIGGDQAPLQNAIQKTAQSLAACISEKGKPLLLPDG